MQDEWLVDLKKNIATHVTGFTVAVEGDPRSPIGVMPGRFPEGLSALDQATLLRTGLKAIMDMAANTPRRPRLKLRSVD